ncbi:MAG TPA: creatininase family protein [Steroidobacteraceae bacterium]|nr:creatininase family protein [Steroidobacteraceae bacterium]
MERVLLAAASVLFLNMAAFAAMPGAPDHARSAASVYIEDLTWPEVKAAIASGKTTAIIYTGSTEQNGPHLALGKHNFIAHYAAGEIAKKLGNALVYPTMPFAPTGSRELRTGHMRFAGSVSIDTETFQAVVRQVAQSALAAGFKNVFLMGDHGGGQDALRAAAKDLEDEYDKLDKTAHVYYVPDLYFMEKQQMKAYLTERGIPYDAHAATDDTSEVMVLDEQKWIRRDKLAPSTADEQPTTGVEGDPTKATPELGKMFLGWKIDDAVNQIHELLAQKQ